MSGPTLYPFPIDFNRVRETLVETIQRITGLTCIEHEPETQNAPRPARPYMAFKLITPSVKMGGDDDQRVSGTPGATMKIVTGGQRKIPTSLHCYALSKEDAANYMTLVQGALGTHAVRDLFEKGGLAVWTVGNVADLSALLNTGYEGRAQMDVDFGIASNITETVDTVAEVGIEGTVDTGSEVLETDDSVEL